MYLSRIEVRSGSLPRLVGSAGATQYAIHQHVWNLFADAPERRRDFLYRQELDATGLSFLVVSNRAPTDPTGLWLINTKEYAPRLEAGNRLVFSLRANPVVSVRDGAGRQSRHDVVMHAKSRLKAGGISSSDWPMEGEIVQSAGVAWLAARCESNGFDVDPTAIRADGYRNQVLRSKRAQHPIRFSTVELTGLLTVTEPDRFLRCLFGGIGPAKGFGCGMMLVRRP